jgi:type I restriction enzyme R subunit
MLMNEAETRAEHIDPALKAAGWGVVEGSRIHREHLITPGRIEGHGKRGKPLTADYVLVYRTHKLAVIEAKAWDEEFTQGVAQAKNYAGKLAVRFTYSTNGRGIYGIDMESGKEGEHLRYPTPDELWNLTFADQNAWRDRFAAVPFPDKSGTWQIRFYQEIAVNRVLGKNRRQFKAHTADACHRHRQDIHRIPDRMEAVSDALELGQRTCASATHPVPRRSQQSCGPGL